MLSKNEIIKPKAHIKQTRSKNTVYKTRQSEKEDQGREGMPGYRECRIAISLVCPPGKERRDKGPYLRYNFGEFEEHTTADDKGEEDCTSISLACHPDYHQHPRTSSCHVPTHPFDTVALGFVFVLVTVVSGLPRLAASAFANFSFARRCVGVWTWNANKEVSLGPRAGISGSGG